MAGGGSSLSAASFPDPREVNIEVGESSSRKPPRPRARPCARPRVRRPPPPPASRVDLSLDMAVEHELKHGDLDPDLGTKRIRRIVSNRLAAQRSRLRRSRRVIDLEAKTKSLEDLIKNLTPQLEALQKSNQLLQEEYDSLQAAAKFHEDQFLISQRLTDDLRAEIFRLKLEMENLNMNQQMQQLQLDVIDEVDDELELELEDEVEVDQYLNLEEIMMNLDSYPGI